MRLTPAQVRLLVFRERDYQDLRLFKLDLIPTERVRALIDRELSVTRFCRGRSWRCGWRCPRSSLTVGWGTRRVGTGGGSGGSGLSWRAGS